MDDAYENALRTVADAYEAEVAECGGKSLSRVATIVVSSGAFFNRLRAGKTFSVANLDRFGTWFRQPSNWPAGTIPAGAAAALCSMGRPPLAADLTHSVASSTVLPAEEVAEGAPVVRRDRGAILRTDRQA